MTRCKNVICQKDKLFFGLFIMKRLKRSILLIVSITIKKPEKKYINIKVLVLKIRKKT